MTQRYWVNPANNNLADFYMFANINLKKFPLVNIDLYDIEKPSDFNDFLNFWEKLHDKNQEYFFLFNTETMSMPSPSYAIKISEFIKKMKLKPYNPLGFSIICVKSAFIRNLVSLVFKFTTPMSPVYLVKTKEEGLQVYEQLRENKEVSCAKVLPSSKKEITQSE